VCACVCVCVCMGIHTHTHTHKHTHMGVFDKRARWEHPVLAASED
jgi:hypothetical protein